MKTHLFKLKELYFNAYIFHSIIYLILITTSFFLNQFHYFFKLISILVFSLFIIPSLGFILIFFFKMFAYLFTDRKDMSFSKKNDNLELTEFEIYGNSFLWGFIFIILISFFLGFILKSLNSVNLYLFLLLIGIVYFFLQVLIILIHPTNHSKNFRRPNKNQKKSVITVISLAILLFTIQILARMPLYFGLDGLGVADSWQIFALSTNTNYYGEILFIKDIIGIFELLPTEKAIVAPLSLSTVSLFVFLNPVEIYFIFNLCFSFIGSIYLFSVLNQFLKKESILKDKNIIALALFGTVLYFLFPYIGIRSLSFYSGRTIFIILFPFFIKKYYNLYTENQNNRNFMIILVISLFLLLAHRLSALITIPLILIYIIFLLVSKKQVNISQNILIILLFSPLISFILRFFLYLIFPSEIITTGWIQGTTFQNSIIELPIIKDFLFLLDNGRKSLILYYIQFLISVNFWSGIYFFIILFDIIISPFLLIKLSKKSANCSFLLSYNIIFRMVIAFIFIFITIDTEEYFFQSIIVILILNSFLTVTTLFYKLEHFNLFNERIIPKIKKIRIVNFLNKFSILILLIILLGQSLIFQQIFAVDKALNTPEPMREFNNEYYYGLVGFLESLNLLNVTILNGDGTPNLSPLGMRLATSLPWLKFLPSHPALYNSYGFVDQLDYSFPKLDQILLNLDFSVLYNPGYSNKSVYIKFVSDILKIFNNFVNNTEVIDLLHYFNIKMAIIPKNLINSDNLPNFYKSIINNIPIYQNNDFLLFSL